MKNLHYPFLLIVTLLIGLPNAVALPSFYVFPTGDNEVSILNPTTDSKTAIPVGPDVIRPDTPVPIEGMTLLTSYQGQNKVYIINVNTHFREAFILSDYIRPIDGDFFILRISKDGNGSGTVITSKISTVDGCVLEIFCEVKEVVTRKTPDDSCPAQDIPGFHCGQKCSSTPCEEQYPKEQSSIIVTAMPEIGSVLIDLNCDEPHQEKPDGQKSEVTVVNCKAQFDILPHLASHAVDQNGEPVDTTATFAGGIYTPETENEISSLSASTVTINGIITVDQKHVDQKTDIIVVANHVLPDQESGTFYMLDGQTEVKPWHGHLPDLSAFQKHVPLAKERWVEIYNGPLPPEGSWHIHFGYRLEKGTIVFNSEPIKFNTLLFESTH